MTKAELLDQLAIDKARFFAKGGEVEELPSCAMSDGRAIQYVEFQSMKSGLTPIRWFEGMERVGA